MYPIVTFKVILLNLISQNVNIYLYTNVCFNYVRFKDFIGQHNAIAKLAFAGALISMALNLQILVKEGDRLAVRILVKIKSESTNFQVNVLFESF